jgi:subtilisin family serine protease
MRIINPELTIEWVRGTLSGKGVSVAIIDSGIEAGHPAMAGRVARGCEVAKGDNGEICCRERPGPECVDCYGHGTSVAGAVLGLAPSADLVSVRVLDQYNACTGHELIAGLRWALDQRIKLINMSLATSKKEFVPGLYELCEQAYNQDTIIVASKRNFGDLGWPAIFSSVISVDRESFPENYWVRYYPKSIIDFGASGTGVRLPTLHGGYALVTGTSFATPHVTGMIALLLEAFPNLLPSEAKTILKSLSIRARGLGD